MRRGGIVTLTVASLVSFAAGQDAPVAETPAELMQRLLEAGVVIPEGFVVNDDGTVSLPAPPAVEGQADGAAEPAGEDQADAAAAAEGEGGGPLEGASGAKEPEWDTKLNLGLNVSAGNTEQIGFASTIVSTRKTDRSELRMDAGYFYGSEDGNDTENQFTAGMQHDWLVAESPWLYFVDFRYDYDDFASYRHRVAGHAGVGLEVIDKEDMDLTLRAGLGGSREFGSENDGIVPEALLGVDFRWDIAENQGLELSHRTFPSLKNSGEFRTLTSAAWNLAIDKDDGLSFTISAIHEYLSEVDPGKEKSDLKLFAGLSYDF